jgi:hypothetical protein
LLAFSLLTLREGKEASGANLYLMLLTEVLPPDTPLTLVGFGFISVNQGLFPETVLKCSTSHLMRQFRGFDYMCLLGPNEPHQLVSQAVPQFQLYI